MTTHEHGEARIAVDPVVSFDFPVAEENITRHYLQLIREPGTTRDSLVAAGEDPDEVDLTLRILAHRGLVEIRLDGTLETHPPEQTLGAFTAEIERQLRRIRAAAPQLELLHRHARDQEHARGDQLRARALSSLAEIRTATSTIVAAAEESILSMRAYGEQSIHLLTSAGVDHDVPVRDAAGQRLRSLAVYDRRLLEVDGVLDVLRRRQAAGEHVRVGQDIPLSVLVVDGMAAVIDLTNVDPDGAGSSSVRHSPLIAGMSALVEGFHRRGLPLPPAEGSPELTSLAGSLSERDLTILTLLATGSSDASVARQLGVSVRTVERRVRELMDRVGATCRMQLGIEAVRRGLLPAN